eukprot:755782-Hanusia_phi.AAC.1
MDFDEISEVVPWVEMAADLEQDLDAEHACLPRAFKTHCWYDHCPKGASCKYIVAVRDPHDVALSFFSFFQGWYFKPGEVKTARTWRTKADPCARGLSGRVREALLACPGYPRVPHAERLVFPPPDLLVAAPVPGIPLLEEKADSECDRWDDNGNEAEAGELQEDLEGHVKEIAKFIGLDHTDGELIRQPELLLLNFHSSLRQDCDGELKF